MSVHDVFVAARAVGALAAAVLCSGWLYLAAAAPAGAALRRTRLTLWGAWLAGLTAAVAGLGLHGADVTGGGFGAAADMDVVGATMETHTGRAWAACAMAFAVALPLLATLRRDSAATARTIWWRLGALVVAAGLLRMVWLTRGTSATTGSASGEVVDFATYAAVVVAGLCGLALLAVASQQMTRPPIRMPRKARLWVIALPIALLMPPVGASPRPRLVADPDQEAQGLDTEQPDADRAAAPPPLAPASVTQTVGDDAGTPPPVATGDEADGSGVAGAPVVDGLTSSGIPEVAMLAYRSAEQTAAVSDPGCGIGWSLLAAIGRVESNHGRYGGAQLMADGYGTQPIRGIPLDGRPGVATIRDSDDGALDGDAVYDRAVGPMQFIPSSWRAVAADGNGDGVASPDNLFDAALGAATYLCAGDGNLRDRDGRAAAVHRYNHSDEYVATVLSLADAYETGRAGTLPNPGPVTPVPPTLPSPPPGSADGDAPPPGTADGDAPPSAPAGSGGSGGGPGGTPTTAPGSTTSPTTTAPSTTSTSVGLVGAVGDLLGL